MCTPQSGEQQGKKTPLQNVLNIGSDLLDDVFQMFSGRLLGEERLR